MILARTLPSSFTGTVAWDDSPCPLCGRDSADVAFEAQDATSRDGLMFSVVRRRECGLHYTNPRPDESSIGRFYASDYKPHYRNNARHRPLTQSRFGWLTGRDCPLSAAAIC